MIDITTVTVRRAHILERTLTSFIHNLFISPNDIHFILNIDNVGDEDCSINDVINTVNSFNFHTVTIFTPDTPSFPTAVKRVWSAVTSDVFFHLEDDWLLLRPIDFNKMQYVMRTEPNLAILRLPIFKTKEDHSKNWKWLFPRSANNTFFECPEDIRQGMGFCGHPSLINKKFLDEVLPMLSDRVDPERLLKGKNPKALPIVRKWRQGVFSEPNQPPAIRDIGREWRKEKGYTKSPIFRTWHKMREGDQWIG